MRRKIMIHRGRMSSMSVRTTLSATAMLECGGAPESHSEHSLMGTYDTCGFERIGSSIRFGSLVL